MHHTTGRALLCPNIKTSEEARWDVIDCCSVLTCSAPNATDWVVLQRASYISMHMAGHSTSLICPPCTNKVAGWWTIHETIELSVFIWNFEHYFLTIKRAGHLETWLVNCFVEISYNFFTNIRSCLQLKTYHIIGTTRPEKKIQHIWTEFKKYETAAWVFGVSLLFNILFIDSCRVNTMYYGMLNLLLQLLYAIP